MTLSMTLSKNYNTSFSMTLSMKYNSKCNGWG
jgi:hypothetical protein